MRLPKVLKAFLTALHDMSLAPYGSMWDQIDKQIDERLPESERNRDLL
jgi:hypothetical protein